MLLLKANEIQSSKSCTRFGESYTTELLGKKFVKVNAHKSLDDAIVSCRNDLELGQLSIVIEDTYEVWMHFPR